MTESKSDILQMPNEVFFPIVVDLLQQDRTVTIPLKGYSMRPFLENERDLALLIKPHAPRLHEPVLVDINGRWILHRIVRIDGDEITLMGDGNLSPEHCKTGDIRASVVGFYRKGRKTLDRIDGRKWRIYSFFWMRLLPIRRYLLFIYRKINAVRRLMAKRLGG